jgi:hypothetical protein
LQVLMARAHARGDRVLALSAQTHAAPFYQRHGFVIEGDEFFEAGIAHIISITATKLAFLCQLPGQFWPAFFEGQQLMADFLTTLNRNPLTAPLARRIRR